MVLNIIIYEFVNTNRCENKLHWFVLINLYSISSPYTQNMSIKNQ